MNTGVVRLGVGTRMLYDGEAVEVIETVATAAGNEIVLKDRLGRLSRVAVKELLFSDRVQFVQDGPGPSPSDNRELASVLLSRLDDEDCTQQRRRLLERAEHVREVRFGYKSGSAELARPDEPRPAFDPNLPKEARYKAKADELEVSVRTVKRWVAEHVADGEAGLAAAITKSGRNVLDRCDPRWVETALEVMGEYDDEATPMQKTVIERTGARLIARFGQGSGKDSGPVDGIRGAGAVGEAASDLPVGHQTQPGHRRPSEEGVRQASPDAAGRVRPDGYHPAGRVRARPAHAALGEL